MSRAINGRKVCSTCKIEKDVNEFYKLKNRIDGLYSVCKECKKKANIIYSLTHPDIRRKIYLKRKDKNNVIGKKWYKNNKEKANKYSKNNAYKYRQTAKKYRETHRLQTNIRQNKRKLIDPIFKLRCKLSTYIHGVLKNSSYIKSAHTIELIGCSVEFLKEHLQKTAITNGYLNFDINNYSGKDYHIDHIIPVNAFSDLSLKEQQLVCFNWSNLQMLKANINITKYNKLPKIIPEHIKPYIIMEEMFT